MENRGVEFSVSTQIIRKRELTWNLDFNATYNENKITNLTVVPGDQNYVGFPSGGIAGGIGGQFAFINSVGYSRNTFYLYKQVYDANGKPLEGVFVDQNRDGVINQDDLYRGKSSVPKVFFGLSSSLNYKRWNLGVVMRSSVGNYVQ
jgi:iron complex outermembrane receptor protein